MVECSSSSDAAGGSNGGRQPCPAAWGLMDYLAERGMVQVATETDADGACVVTYHLTERGFRLLEKILGLLDLLKDPSPGSEEIA